MSLRTIKVSLSHQILVMDILYRPSMKGNIRQEPQCIVFLSQLMLLFRFCQTCKSDDIIVDTSERGTMICVQTQCGNPKCSKRDLVWQSQPLLEDTKTAAGNILLSFTILLAGASASKVLRVFSHMGVARHSLRQFYRHQKVSNTTDEIKLKYVFVMYIMIMYTVSFQAKVFVTGFIG